MPTSSPSRAPDGPSSSSSSSAFRRLPTLSGLSKPRSPFKRSTAPSSAPVSADLAPGGVNELAGLAASEGYERRGKEKRGPSASMGGLHLGLGTRGAKESSGGGSGISSLLGAVGLGSPSHGSHAAHMQALRNGGRSSSDKVGTTSMPASISSGGGGGWLTSSGASTGSTIGRRSASRRQSSDAPSASGSSFADGGGGSEEVVDIGFATGLSAQRGNDQRTTPPRSDERTPTRERADPLAYAFPPRSTEPDPLPVPDWQTARTARLGSEDSTRSTHALAPPTMSPAAKRRSIVIATAAHEAAHPPVQISPQARHALAELGPALPSSPADERTRKDDRETIRTKRRSQRFDLGQALPEPPSSAPGDLSATYRLPQSDPSRRPSYEPPLPPQPERTARSREGSTSASASRAHSRKPSRSGDGLAQALEERLTEENVPSIPRRKSSNRLRRRASTTDGSKPAPRLPASDPDLPAETPDGTASSSGENVEMGRVRSHTRQSSRSRKFTADPFREPLPSSRSQGEQINPTSPLPPVQQNGPIPPTRQPMQRDDSAETLDRAPSRPRADGQSASDDQRQVKADGSSSQRRQRRQTEGAETIANSPTRHSKPGRSGTQRERGTATPRTPLKMTLPSDTIRRAPKTAMYFYQMPFHGIPPPQPLRAHTSTLVGQSIYVIGGTDTRRCWEGAAKFDTETLGWSVIDHKADGKGDRPPRLRAHSATLVGKTVYVFGGGDGAVYSNEVWALDTVTDRWSRPRIGTPDSALPPTRRAHTAVLHEGRIVVFGGGNGQAALNDVWALDVSDASNLTWTEWQTQGDVPPSKGYHTANLVGHKMLIYGGSDGKTSFSDVHVLDLKTLRWTLVRTAVRHSRLSHTATQVGSYLFVVGGHDGQNYAQEILLLNLVTLAWESKTVHGQMPSGRGYHTAISHDARLFVMGGYNGKTVFDDVWCLELAASAYLPQVTAFEIDETFSNDMMDGEEAAQAPA